MIKPCIIYNLIASDIHTSICNAFNSTPMIMFTHDLRFSIINPSA